MKDARAQRYVGQVTARLLLDRESRRKVRTDLETGLAPLIAEHGVDEALKRFGSADEVADAFAEQGYQLRGPRNRTRRVLAAGLVTALALLLVFFISQYAGRASRGQDPSTTNVDISAVYMVNDQVGWAFSGPAVLRTDDGGEHWRNVTPNGYGPDAHGTLAFSGSDRCWLAVWDQNAEKLMVFRTADGGKHWEPSIVPADSNGAANYPRSLAISTGSDGGMALWLMIEPEHGMNSAPGILFKSVDSGQKWTLVAQSSDHPDNLPFTGDVSFVSDARGWVVGSQVSTVNRKLYRTDDGGATWREVTLQLPSGLPAGGMDFADPPRFFDRQTGLLQVTFVPDSALADEFRTLTFFTRDGGTTWTDASVTKGKPSFIDRQTGFQVSGGALLKTIDGGRNWTGVKSDISSFVTADADVQFVQANDGWALVHYPTVTFVIRTTDGGVTWTRPGESTK